MMGIKLRLTIKGTYSRFCPQGRPYKEDRQTDRQKLSRKYEDLDEISHYIHVTFLNTITTQ